MECLSSKIPLFSLVLYCRCHGSHGRVGKFAVWGALRVTIHFLCTVEDNTIWQWRTWHCIGTDVIGAKGDGADSISAEGVGIDGIRYEGVSADGMGADGVGVYGIGGEDGIGAD